jgi:hypothetical protein
MVSRFDFGPQVLRDMLQLLQQQQLGIIRSLANGFHTVQAPGLGGHIQVIFQSFSQRRLGSKNDR